MALFYQTAIIEVHQEEIAGSALYCLMYLMGGDGGALSFGLLEIAILDKNS